jgi:membrane-bound ClpP family serine protease
MSPLIFAALLLLLALALVVLEMFVPSGGAISVLAALSAGGGVFLAYYYGGLVTGTLFLGAVVIAVPVVLAVAVQVWPHTPIGRSVMIGLPESEDEVLPDDPERQALKSLIGRRGVAKSDLLPSGAVLVDKQTYDALSEGMAIDRGQAVQVVAVRMHALVVRPAEIAADEPAHYSDPLAHPLEEFGLDPLEDPLA